MQVPRQADLACGNRGVIAGKTWRATHVEDYNELEANLLNAYADAGTIDITAPNPTRIEMQARVEEVMEADL